MDAVVSYSDTRSKGPRGQGTVFSSDVRPLPLWALGNPSGRAVGNEALLGPGTSSNNVSLPIAFAPPIRYPSNVRDEQARVHVAEVLGMLIYMFRAHQQAGDSVGRIAN